MWTLTITCTAYVAVCLLNPDPPPMVKREFASKIACDKTLLATAENWHPQGAWKMNCVERR